MSRSLVLGLERFIEEKPKCVAGRRFGLLFNRASVNYDLRLSCDVLAESFPGQLVALFTPQHGLWGDAQANMIETGHGWHDRLKVPVYSLYSETRSPTSEMLAGLETLVIDLQDVGTRVYTYIWTLQQCLVACAEAGLPMIVLDRPNPLGGVIVEGPSLNPQYRSFVGGESIPMRHGLTIGEMARLLNERLARPAELEVIPMSNWASEQPFTRLGRNWVPPSPNLPTATSAYVYPGQVLLEGTNLSEGRGTTTPFELTGAPYVDPLRLQQTMEAADLPGVRFLPVRFRPSFDKWAGTLCGGVSIHVTQWMRFRPYAMTVRLLSEIASQSAETFGWLDPPYEYELVRPPIDIISGSDRLRFELGRATVEKLCAVDLDAWNTAASPALLYHRPSEAFRV